METELQTLIKYFINLNYTIREAADMALAMMAVKS